MEYDEYVKIKNRLETDLAALERVWEMSKEQPVELIHTQMPKSLTGCVKLAINEINTGITRPKIIHWLKIHKPEIGAKVKPPSVSGILYNLSKRGLLILTSHGKGCRPSIYKKSNVML